VERAQWFFYGNVPCSKDCNSETGGGALFDGRPLGSVFSRSGLTSSRDAGEKSKQSLYAFQQLVSLLGDRHFVGVLREDPAVWAYLLGDSDGTVTHVVAWRPVDGDDQTSHTVHLQFSFSAQPDYAVILGLGKTSQTAPLPTASKTDTAWSLLVSSAPTVVKIRLHSRSLLGSDESVQRRLASEISYAWRSGEERTIASHMFISGLTLETQSDWEKTVQLSLAELVGCPVTDVVLAVGSTKAASIRSDDPAMIGLASPNPTRNVAGVRFKVEIATPESAIIVTRMKLNNVRTKVDYNRRFAATLRTNLVNNHAANEVILAITSVPVMGSSSLVDEVLVLDAESICNAANYTRVVRPTCVDFERECLQSIQQASTMSGRKKALCGTMETNVCRRFYSCVQGALQGSGCAGNKELAVGLEKFHGVCTGIKEDLPEHCAAKYSQECK
jgi:hypothetical protein